jgi:predicted short-subunit dehydrogenase-like oxidoreductase (DUF2520 family)
LELSIIGAGRLGGALAIALEKSGWSIVNIVSRRLESAEKLAKLLQSSANNFQINDLTKFELTQIVLITTPDPEIKGVAEILAKLQTLNKQTVFLHTSGSLSSDVLHDLREKGGKIGSLHPLVSVSNAVLGAENFKGAYFCIEGDAEAVEIAEKIASDLAGNSFTIPTAQKPLYHAAAVMSAGHLVALFDLASETLADCGIEKHLARAMLLPLVSSTVENLKKQTPAAALTGTFARADLETMRKHLTALKGKNAARVYIELGKKSLQLAAEQAVDKERLTAMRQELDRVTTDMD